jgi:hypothetical protein
MTRNLDVTIELLAGRFVSPYSDPHHTTTHVVEADEIDSTTEEVPA